MVNFNSDLNSSSPRVSSNKTEGPLPSRRTISSVKSSKVTASKTKLFSNNIMENNKNIINSTGKTNLNPEKVNNQGLMNEIMSEVNKIAENQETIKNISDTLKKTNKDLPKLKHLEVGETMTVYRGCRPDQLAKMLLHGSAGGEPANESSGKPTEQAANDQVAEKKSIPEFTTNYGIAQNFGRGHIVVAMSIKKQNLYLGSVSELGVVCNPDAPIKLLAWKPGPPFEMPNTEEKKGNLSEKGHVITNDTKEII